MWRGQVSFETPMLWTLGFLVTFLFGGLTGILLSAPPRRLPGLGLLLRRGALPLRGVRHRRVRDVRRLLLLVAEVDRADARRAPRQDPLLAAVRRLPHDVPRPALARRRGHAPPVRRLPASRTGSPTLNRSSARSARSSSATSTLPFLWNVYKTCKTAPLVDGRRPVGLGLLARVGDLLPAAAAQLHVASRGSARSARRSTCTTPSWSTSRRRSGTRCSTTSSRQARRRGSTREDRRLPVRWRRRLLRGPRGRLLVHHRGGRRLHGPGAHRRPGVPHRVLRAVHRAPGRARGPRTTRWPTSRTPSPTTASSARTRGGRSPWPPPP